jgi:hypothetical protein
MAVQGLSEAEAKKKVAEIDASDTNLTPAPQGSAVPV